MKNLAQDASYKAVMDDMRKALDKNIRLAQDVMFLPEYEMKKLPASTTPYEFRRDENRYPLQKIYAAAELSGRRGGDVARQQVRLLRSGDKIVRYWAALGLRSQETDVLATVKAAILGSIDDTYPPVAIIASAIAYDQWGDEKAGERLNRFVLSENHDLALMTINFLLYVREPGPFIDAVSAVYLRSDIPYDLSAASKDFLGKLNIIPNDWENR